MTVTSGFFNSQNHDRVYDAEQLSSIFDGVILDGVYQGVGDAFQVVPNENLDNSVIVKTGRAWFDHTWIVNDSDFSITLSPPNTALDRYDAIVLDIDRTLSVRSNSIKYIAGEYSATPTYPTLVKSELHNQYPICYIQVLHGSDGPISQSYIINKVGTSDCPIVTGVLEVMNSDMFTAKMESEFYEWFDGIKTSLDGDVAANLQRQITDLQDQLNKQAEYGISEENYNFSQNAKISLVYNSAKNYSHLITILQDGCFVTISSRDEQANGSVDFSTLYANLHNSEGLCLQSLPILTKDENRDTVESVALCYADMDEYPATMKFAYVYGVYNNDTEYYNNFRCRYYTLTISSEKIMSINSVTQDVPAHNIAKTTHYNFSALPAYMNDGSRIIGSSVVDMSSTFDHYCGCLFRLTEDGTISQAVETTDTASNVSTLGMCVTDYANTALYYGSGNGRWTTYSPSSLTKLTDSEHSFDTVIDSYRDLKAWNDAYFFVNGKQYSYCKNTYDFRADLNNINPSISLISDISKAESSIGYLGGYISKNGSVLLSNTDSSNSNCTFSAALFSSGLNIWSTPTDLPIVNSQNAVIDNANTNDVASSSSLVHPYKFWESSDKKTFLISVSSYLQFREVKEADDKRNTITMYPNNANIVIRIEVD